MTIDHVIPQALGGKDTPDNLVACCFDCNLGKASTNPDDPLVADVSAKALEFHRDLLDALESVSTTVEMEDMYVKQILDMWESITETDATHCLPLPDSWKSTVRYWLSIGVTDAIVQYAFEISKERYDAHRIPAYKAFRYSTGIVGNRMEEAHDLAQKRFEQS
jgi:hypothetical protein